MKEYELGDGVGWVHWLQLSLHTYTPILDLLSYVSLFYFHHSTYHSLKLLVHLFGCSLNLFLHSTGKLGAIILFILFYR